MHPQRRLRPPLLPVRPLGRQTLVVVLLALLVVVLFRQPQRQATQLQQCGNQVLPW